MARLRLGLVGVVIGVLFLAMFARLYSLQVLSAGTYTQAALTNEVQAVAVAPPRGNILSRSGATVVGSTTTEAVTLSRYVAAQHPEVIGRLARVLHTTTAKVQAALADNQFSAYVPVPIATDVPKDIVVYIAEHGSAFPGVTAQPTVEVTYPYANVAAQSLGYLGPVDQTELRQPAFRGYSAGDLVGQSGIEAQYNRYLYGQPGVTDLSVNRAGDVVGTVSTKAPTPGDSVQLNMDLGLQQALQADLAKQILAVRGTYVPTAGYAAAPGGAAVVMDPQNGHVLAMASYPSYDPSVWVGGISNSAYRALSAPGANQPLLNRAIQGLYTPGSTFKLATATAALDDGLITPSYTYDDATSSFTVPNCTGGTCTFYDNASAPQGVIDVSQALTASDDPFFYNLGYMFYRAYETNGQYGFTPIQQTATAYSLGTGTGIDLPGESTGYVDSLAVDQKLCAGAPHAYNCPATWYAGNNVEMAFGQGATLVTPIELADAYATFANGGTRYQPQMVGDIVSPVGKIVKSFAPVVSGHLLISPANRAALLQGFIGAVQSPTGTASGAFQGFDFSKLAVAGKTGTSSINQKVPNSLFVAFAGKDITHPQYVVAVVIEQAGYGAAESAPVARQALQYLMEHPPGPMTLPKPSPVLVPELVTPKPCVANGTTSSTTASSTTASSTTTSSTTTSSTTTSSTTTSSTTNSTTKSSTTTGALQPRTTTTTDCISPATTTTTSAPRTPAGTPSAATSPATLPSYSIPQTPLTAPATSTAPPMSATTPTTGTPPPPASTPTTAAPTTATTTATTTAITTATTTATTTAPASSASTTAATTTATTATPATFPKAPATLPGGAPRGAAQGAVAPTVARAPP